MNNKADFKLIPVQTQPQRPKRTSDRTQIKGTASSTPKTRLRPETVTEPDVVLWRRNQQTVSQNLSSNVTTRKAARPISYQHVPNKALPIDKPTNFGLKATKSIPSLLEVTNKQLRPVSTKIRGKAGKEHHHHHHSTQSTVAPLESASSTLTSSVSGAAGAGAPTSLPRTSSASANLNVLAAAAAAAAAPKSAPQTSKSARGKGGGSRERLVDGTTTGCGGDASRKLQQQQQQQTVPVHRGERPVSGEEALVELQQMQRQLLEMATEKSTLMLQLQERSDLINDLQNEIKVLKIYQEQSVHQLGQKTEENAYLRSKLRDVVHSPLSDSEKQQLLLIDSHRHHSSAPASIAVNVANETGDATACPTPEWDKNSSSNVSDVSVACLQDKINQMQETHYSTNEELQATLQELTDLQRQLTELQLHNNRLGDEKNLMFDSLCRQTDRLKDTRSELDHLKQLLNTTQDNTTADSVQQYAEREAQLLDIVQRLEVERDNLRDRQQELLQDLQHLRNSNDQGEEERSRLIERVRMLEGSMDAKVAENRQTEQELSQVRDECSGSKIEIDRLKDILESARTKIVELEQDRDLSDKSELGELLDTARKEKDSLELEITHLREQVAKSRNEIEKLREQVSILQEECKVTRNNAKCTQSELEYKVETLISDKTNLIEQLQRLQETVGDFEVQNQCLNEDKRQLNGVLSETQRNLSEAEEKLVLIVAELSELKKLRDTENEEWEKFQNDLLTSVRVANDFKTEAQQDLQKIVLENKGFREKVRLLEIQMDKLKDQTTASVTSAPTVSAPPLSSSNSPQSPVQLRPALPPAVPLLLSCIDQQQTDGSSVVPQQLQRQNSRQSVKSLIESIENSGTTSASVGTRQTDGAVRSANKQQQQHGDYVRSPSATSSESSQSLATSPTCVGAKVDWTTLSEAVKQPLREQISSNNRECRDWGKNVITDSLSKVVDLVKCKTEDAFRCDTKHSTKAMEYRRNSYTDIADRKDPLNHLVKNGGSKRNALLKWCQCKTVGYRNIDITNFSSSWNDGLALCALLHTYLSDRISYDSLTAHDKRRNFALAFAAAESVGITTSLNINDMVQLERPDWQQVMSYVTAIYRHFES